MTPDAKLGRDPKMPASPHPARVLTQTPRVGVLHGLALSLPLLFLAVFLAVAHGQEDDRAHTFRTTHGGPALSVRGRARTGVQPKSVNVSPDGTRVISCNFGRPDAHSVTFFDAYTLEAVGEAEFLGNAVESVFSRDGSVLFVSNFRRHVVEVLDPTSCYAASPEAPCHLTPIAEIAVGHHPKFMALSPDETLLYVANYGDATVSVVDVPGRTELRRLRTLRHPRGMVVLPDGTLLAAAFHGDTIHIFPEGAAEESGRWETCAMPRHLLLSPDASTVYVTCSMGHVGFYDTRTGHRYGIGALGRNPRSISISSDGRWIGSANFTSSDVSLVDTVDRRNRTYEVEGARRIVGLAMHPGPGVRIYASSWDTNEIIMLSDADAEAAHPSGTRSEVRPVAADEGHAAAGSAPSP